MKLERANAWANTIIAASAVVALALALIQTRETSLLVSSASDAFKASTFPVVKFQRYQWFSQNAPASCDNPAFGFNVYYQNVSGVPVALEDVALLIYMGDRPIHAGPSELTLDMPGGPILAPGQALATGFRDDQFPEVYLRMHGPGPPPHLNFRLDVRYRSVVTGEQYCYTAKVVILEDCRLPSQQQYQLGSEDISKCKPK